MMLRLVGAAMVIAGCGGFGFRLAYEYRQEETALRGLLNALGYMEAELRCRSTPLPDVWMEAGALSRGPVQQVLVESAAAMQRGDRMNAGECISEALRSSNKLPASAARLFLQLGSTLGCFDLEGQLQQLDGVRSACSRTLEELASQRDTRIRNYQTLGICAGVALAILLL